MSRGIRLHPKYGVNPTIPTCFWCGKSKNEVALLGVAYRGQAPMHMLLDTDPCSECEAKFTSGIAVFEVNGMVFNERRGKDEPDFTGRYMVITEDAARRWFTPEAVVAEVLKYRKAYMDREGFKHCLSAAKEAEA